MDTILFIKAFGGFFAIMNPFVNLPLFLGLTKGTDQTGQRRAARNVTLYSAILSGVIMLAGSQILHIFGISIADFQVAGGIVVMMIALGMLNGHGAASHSGTASEQAHQAQRDDIAFYPMTFPMIVGPGTITTLIVFTGQAQSASDLIAVAMALIAVLALLSVVLWFAADISHHMSQSLRTITTRLMGMILAAIAVEMIAAGLKVVLPGLA